MPLWAMLLACGLVALVGGSLGHRRALTLAASSGARRGALHSRPTFHGWFVALAALIPSLIVVMVWALAGDGVVASAVEDALPPETLPEAELDRLAFLNDVRGLARGTFAAGFAPGTEEAARVWRAVETRYAMLAGAAAIALALFGALWALGRISPGFRARTRVESLVIGLLVLSSLVAILTTLGIVVSLVFESFRFFQMVPVTEFLFGTQWSPQIAMRADQVGASGAFGAVPLFWGTIFIGAIIAMLVAIPLGLMTAIYLTQYAAPGFRAIAKPVLEVLAGVPTVVYGFFAALTVAPAVRDLGLWLASWFPLLDPQTVTAQSALAAGLVMGIMIIPFISSMADDALAAVPNAMRDGSLALGATTSETIQKVLIPAALPGIVGGVLLAVSRAIGETMIVVMAAGLAAKLTANPFDSVTTVTVQIVKLMTGDQEFDSPKTLSAFALGLTLFLVTLALNICALAVVKRYREAYE
ncbi:phosphate ABC transporter permease subunit PstC [Thermaurantiacus sp.]